MLNHPLPWVGVLIGAKVRQTRLQLDDIVVSCLASSFSCAFFAMLAWFFGDKAIPATE